MCVCALFEKSWIKCVCLLILSIFCFILPYTYCIDWIVKMQKTKLMEKNYKNQSCALSCAVIFYNLNLIRSSCEHFIVHNNSEDNLKNASIFFNSLLYRFVVPSIRCKRKSQQNPNQKIRIRTVKKKNQDDAGR